MTSQPREAPLRTLSPAQADKILAAAARLFATHRFHEARMEDIAALAGVGKGTLYRYFKDKEELYLGLLARAAEDILARQHRAMQDHACPHRRLVAFVAAVFEFFDEQPHVFDLIQHAEAMQGPDREFPWQHVRNQSITLVEGVLRDGHETGLWQVDDVPLATLMLLGGLRAVLRFWQHPRPAGAEERIVDGFLRGFARERTGPPPLSVPSVPLPD